MQVDHQLAKVIADFIVSGEGLHEEDQAYVYDNDLNYFGVDGRINLVALAKHLLETTPQLKPWPEGR